MTAFLRRVQAIARKEVQTLLRDPWTLLVCFVEPVFTLCLYGYCLNFDLHRIPYEVWDQDHSQAARELVRRIDAAGGTTDPLFQRMGYISPSGREIELRLRKGDVRFVLVIPHDFERDLEAGRPVQVQALMDAADSNTAGIAAGYLGAAVGAHNLRLITTDVSRRHGTATGGPAARPLLGGSGSVAEPIDIRWRVLFNPSLSSNWFIVPGLMAVLLSILAATLTSITITRERETGTLESLLTAPVGAADLVIGKMAPYLAVSLLNVTVALGVGRLVFHIWPHGSLFTFAWFTLLFLPGMLALGMLISALAPTQQFALVLATLTGFLPTLFLTGFAFPRSNMGGNLVGRVLQQISWPLPATQYMIAIRSVFLKGTGWDALWLQALWMVISGTVLVGLAMLAMRAKMARGLE